MENKQKQEWSIELKNKTRSLWHDREVVPLIRAEMGLAFKHIDRIYGYVDAVNVWNGRLLIEPYPKDKDGKPVEYPNIEAAIADGWVVD